MKKAGWWLLAGFLLAASTASAEPWPEAPPESQGMDSTVLADIRPRVNSGEFANLNSIVIIRHGQLVWEDYFRGYDEQQLFPLYSVTKSFGSTLIGMAEFQGRVNTDAQLLGLFPQYAQSRDPQGSDTRPLIENMSNRKRAIRLEDVLTMRTGLRWEELQLGYDSPINPLFLMINNAPDWTLHILDLPHNADPGERYNYNTGQSNLMSGVLKTRTGRDGRAFADEYLFPTIGIEQSRWELSFAGPGTGNGITQGPEGTSLLGHSLWLRTRDMARLGELYLRDGVWGDERLFASDWVERAWTRHSNNGTDPNVFTQGRGYGYQWYITEFTTPENDTTFLAYAYGFGDQYMLAFPEYDLVVATTSDNYQNQTWSVSNLLRDLVLSAVNGPSRAIDHHTAGSWYKEEASGQGFTIQVLADRQEMLIFWFTYDRATDTQRWFSAQGPYAGATAEMVVTETTGGRFDAGDPVVSGPVGTLSFRMVSCNEAHAEYDLDELGTGQMLLNRLSGGVGCDAAN